MHINNVLLSRVIVTLVTFPVNVNMQTFSFFR